MTQHNIPAATLAAGQQSDPDWWLACAEWHEQEAASEPLAIKLAGQYHSAAALACRTFALMMRREQEDAILPCWKILRDGEATWGYGGPEGGRSLPAAAVAALTEEDA